MSNISLSQLLEAGVHFGHKSYRWNPKMFPYIYSEVNNIHILDLVQSASLLNEATNYLNKLASEGKTFLFIGTKRQASTLIAQEAKRCNSYYVNYRWLGGMLTNWSTLKERINRLKSLEQQEADNTFDLLTKKEASLRRKELEKLRNHLDGIKNMQQLLDSYPKENSNPDELIAGLKAEFGMIFKKCTMTGEAHEQLHNYLIPLKTKIESLSEPISDENTNDLKMYLEDYFNYFH